MNRLLFIITAAGWAWTLHGQSTEQRTETSQWLADYNLVLADGTIHQRKETLYFESEADLDAWLLEEGRGPNTAHVWIARIQESWAYRVEPGATTVVKNPDPINTPFRVNFEQLAGDGSGVWVSNCFYSTEAGLQAKVDAIIADPDKRLILSDPPFRTEHWETSLVTGPETVTVYNPNE